MSTERTLDAVEFDMGQLAVRIGMATYNVEKAQKDLKIMINQLDDLNFEAIKLRGTKQ